MPIKVYWACLEDEWLAAEEPEKVIKRISKFYQPTEDTYLTPLLGCPAIRDELSNLYALRSLYDYSFTVTGTEVKSSVYDQKFYDKHVEVRSTDSKFFSFHQRFIFFTEEDSLNMTAYIYPFLEDNDVTKNCMIVPGSYDIGKWFRNLEFPFFLRPSSDTFSIKSGDVYSYIKFDTQEPIVFQQFRWNASLDEYRLDGFRLNLMNSKAKKLKDYYSMFKNKKLILKEIQNNLLT